MKLGIQLAILNNIGTIVSLVNDDMDSIELYGSLGNKDAKVAIDRSIKKLNEIISKLEKLKLEDKPFTVTAQEKINGFKS